MGILFMEEFGKAFIFKKIRPTIKKYFMKAGYEEVPYKFFGALFWISIVLTYLLVMLWIFPKLGDSGALVTAMITFMFWVIIQLGIMFIATIFYYFYLDLKIYHRTKRIEEKLPDYLVLVSTNLKGGMSFEKSLWNSIRDEFDILSKEITLVSKKVMTGNDLSEALMEFAEKYNSPLVRRSINLVIGEIESGGKIVDVIDKVIENLRKARMLKQEMIASTVTYMIFIGAIVIVISPALFALSHQLLQIIINFTAQISSAGASTQMPFTVSKLTLQPQDYQLFSIMAIITTSLFSAMIISIIEKGDIKGGIKYVPLFMISSLVLYFIFLTLLESVFKGVVAIP
ncbi:MAG: type II secretion system F family protein [archaeon]